MNQGMTQIQVNILIGLLIVIACSMFWSTYILSEIMEMYEIINEDALTRFMLLGTSTENPTND